MSRAERLLELMQALRRHRHPVGGAALAAGLGISLRTLYRDIASLQAQGACIDGAPGVGYVLRPGFTLPPMMFSAQELDALALGLRWVGGQADAELGAAARDALAKVAAVLPAVLRHELDSSALLVGASAAAAADDRASACIRDAIRRERKLDIAYRDLQGSESTRTVWPFALGFFDRVRVMAAWCELRDGFRHFRCDRIASVSVLPVGYPHRRQALLRQWRRSEGIDERIDD